MHFPEKLRLLMRRHGLTQAALGTHLGVSQRAVGKWLAGDSAPGAEIGPRLADFFEVQVDDLLDDTRELPPPTHRQAVMEDIPADSRWLDLPKEVKQRLVIGVLLENEEIRAMLEKHPQYQKIMATLEGASPGGEVEKKPGLLIHKAGAGKTPEATAKLFHEVAAKKASQRQDRPARSG